MLIKLQKSQVHHIIIQKQLQTNMANKYLKKDIYIYISKRKTKNYWWSKINI